MQRLRILWLKVIGRIAWSAKIYPGVKVGNNCYIGPYCRVGGMAEMQSKWPNVPVGKVVIGDNSALTAFVNVDSGVEGVTHIGENCYLMVFSHIGHDAVIADNVTISPHAVVGGHTVVKKLCVLGIGSALHQQITIPEKVMVGMNAAVTKKGSYAMKPAQTWGRVPARLLGPNKKWIKA